MTAVVFLHHFGGSARTAEPVIDRLDPAVDVLALDLPGYGDAAGAAGPYDVDAYADFVVARLGVLSERFVLVGHSMGGKVALALAARRPTGLVALLLLAPSPPTPEPIADAARAKLIAGWGEYSTMSETLEEITAEPLGDTSRRLAISDMMRTGKGAWNAWLEHGSRQDISDRLSRVEAPVTILAGTRDTVLPTSLQRRTAAMLGDARVIAVRDAGHLLPLEAPGAVAHAIGSLLSDLAPVRLLSQAAR